MTTLMGAWADGTIVQIYYPPPLLDRVRDATLMSVSTSTLFHVRALISEIEWRVKQEDCLTDEYVWALCAMSDFERFIVDVL